MSSKAESSASLIPERRFPGYSGPWDHEPLSSVLMEHKVKNADGHEVFSVSMESGIVNQIAHLGRSFAAADTSHYHVGHRFDVVYTKSPLKAFPFGIVKQCKSEGKVALSPLYGVFTPKNPHVGLMIEAFFAAPERAQAFLSPLCQKGAKNTLQITNATFLSGRMALPKEEGEQKIIAECLASADTQIEAQERKVEALRAHKKGLMNQLFPSEGKTQPRRRFPEFEGAGEWEEARVEDVILTVTPPKKIPTSDYQVEGALPIIDQSQEFTSGWTNDVEALIGKGLPLIVFGDHTCALKFVSTPFAQGADGIKIIRPKRGLDTRFLFYALEANPVVQDGYKRHFSVLKEKIVFFPDPKSGEQQRVADCLTSLDDLIAAEARKLDTLKTHKRGLIQQLFPQVGEG